LRKSVLTTTTRSGCPVVVAAIMLPRRRTTMPDLKDGESMEMRGSASRPYVLKNIGGVYSCSCPAWRNQSLPIERRTCKHLRKLRGDAAEEARVGAALPSQFVETAVARAAPPLLLAESWDGATDPKGWLLSEKLDGVRAWWTGTSFLSRQGNIYHAPAWFTAGLPNEPLDGELWIARRQFQRTVSIVRRQDGTELWREVRFVIFDTPAHDGKFRARLKLVESIVKKNAPPYALAHEHSRCRGVDHLREELSRIEALGGEGLMLRQPASKYEAGRSLTLLKVKTFRDAEARVIAYEPGAGRHQGGRAVRGDGRRHTLRRGHGAERQGARPAAGDRQHDHFSLSGADGRGGAAVSHFCWDLPGSTFTTNRRRRQHAKQDCIQGAPLRVCERHE